MNKKIDEMMNVLQELEYKKNELFEQEKEVKRNFVLREGNSIGDTFWLAEVIVHDNNEISLKFNTQMGFCYERSKKLAKWLQELFLEEENNVRKKDT